MICPVELPRDFVLILLDAKVGKTIKYLIGTAQLYGTSVQVTDSASNYVEIRFPEVN